MKRILLIDTVHPLLPEGLRTLGYQVDEDYQSSPEDLQKHIEQYTGLIIRSRFPLSAPWLQKATQLRFIGRVGAGLENIDLKAVQRQNIILLNAPEGNRNAVAEHAMGMLLMLLNHLRRADQEVRSGKWYRAPNRGTELEGKTVGIIGCGHTGSALARKLSGFDVTLKGYDPYREDKTTSPIPLVSLAEIQRTADVISFHVPENAETLHYFDDTFLDRLEKPVYLINTSRGKVVKTSSVVQGLRTGKLLGACLDVLEYEKNSFEHMFTAVLPDDFEYLTRSEQVVLSPHIAGWSHESHQKMAKVLLDKITALKLT